ncbi:aldehyde dehydrogenase family protein [Alcaligenaceae bacterium]|nr:aldehyde dehydrogenase family protein [Alcaligenaceae bacterium]
MSKVFQNYVNGQWQASASDATMAIADPNTGSVRSQVPTGAPEDAQAAITAAASALSGWARTPLTERIDAVKRLAEALNQRAGVLASTIAGEVGTPLKISHYVQTMAPIRNCANFVKVAEAFEWSREVANSLVVREPVGVVACITPWNFPLHQIVLKVVPALLCGNTVVLKPSELTPETTRLFAEAVHEAGFPAGVVNIVNGNGAQVGMPMVTSKLVNMVSFTGSTATGQAVMREAAATVKKVSLELGGKSPSVILPSADLLRAIKGTLGGCMLNNGQTCNALTRVLVPEDKLDEFKTMIAAEVKKLTVGASLEATTRLGPVISATQQQRVQDLVRKGIEQGASVIASVTEIPSEGFFVSPMVLEVKPDNVLAREEVFGPVLSVLTYKTVEEAVAIANDTDYGLAAAVWGEPEEAMSVANQLRAGQVDLNGAPFNPLAPFGGFGMSGIGREAGSAGLEEFLEYKSIQQPLPAKE